MLEAILFNIFLDDLLAVLKKSQLYSFAEEDNMIGNPDKFWAIVLHKGNKNNNTNITLNVENITICTSKSLKLLGITFDNKLNFEEHISVLCKKASLQLNSTSPLQKYMEKKKKNQ